MSKKDNTYFIGGLTQIKNWSNEDIDKIVDEVIPINQNDFDIFLNLIFGDGKDGLD